MGYFVYRLIPPRPTFVDDQSHEEAAVMRRHAGYWSTLTAQGVAVLFGPVADPHGVWGLAVVEAGAARDVHELADADPAVSSGVCSYAVLPMLSATLRP